MPKTSHYDGPVPMGALSGIRPAPGVWVHGDGPLPAPIMLIGERPGETEAKRDRPFCGASGQILNDWLERADLARDRLYATNLVKDFKPGNPEPQRWEVERDRKKLLREIRACEPTVIGAVGAHAVHFFLGPDADMETVHGIPFPVALSPIFGEDVFGVDGIAGTVPTDADEVIVVPVYHPANSFYNVDLAARGQYDIDVLGMVIRQQVAVRTPDAHPKPHYELIDYDPVDFMDWAAVWQPSIATHYFLAIDTEGSIKRPWCLSFTQVAGWAAVLKKDAPAMRQFIAELMEFIAAGGRVLLHNSMHDLGVLRALGIDLPPGSFIDTMVIAYQLCLEPQGLKPLAYRHAGMLMSSYEELVNPANLRLAEDYVRLAHALKDEWPLTEPYITFERNPETKVFEPKIKKPWHIERYLRTLIKEYEEKKKPVDLRSRWHNIDDDIRKPVEDALGPMPEATLDDLQPEDGDPITYAARDADGTLRIAPTMIGRAEALGIWDSCEIDFGAIPMFERMQANGMAVNVPHFMKLGQLMIEKMFEHRQTIKQITGAEINPDSPIQVADLLYGQLGLSTRIMTKGGKSGKKKPSTGDKALEALRFAHPAVPPILDYRECSKIKSSFCDPLARLTARDGRVHTTLRVTKVTSGRISSSSPNLTAQPVRSELGLQLREGFVAPTKEILAEYYRATGCDWEPVDCILGEWDLDQAEMRVMAHESEDEYMCELLTNPLYDIHSETAARMFGLKIVNSPIKKERYQFVHPVIHRYPAKRVGFGVITGITGKGLENQMALANATKNGLKLGEGGEAWTEDDCDLMIIDWFKVFRKVRSYINWCRAETRRQGWIADMWGRIRYLPGIFSEKSWIREEAERQSHSHRIQAGAQGLLKRAMAVIWGFNLEMYKAKRRVEPLIQIHDSLTYELEHDPELMEYWDAVMVNSMSNTTKLRVPMRANGKYAKSWGKLKD